MGISKVIYGGNTLIDLTNDTVTKDKLLKGFTAHGPDGEPVTGECAFDVDSSEVTATDAEVLNGKTYAKAGSVRTGSMPNNGAVAGTITTKDGDYTVPQGYHDGSGKVAIDDAEKAKLVAENIREGITLLGVLGTMSGAEDVLPQAKTVTPTTKQQEVLPDDGYTHLSSVTVESIPYVEGGNVAGGTTVTIG